MSNYRWKSKLVNLIALAVLILIVARFLFLYTDKVTK